MDSDRFKMVEKQVRAFGLDVHNLNDRKEMMFLINMQVKFMTEVDVKSLEFHMKCLKVLSERLYFKNLSVCVE